MQKIINGIAIASGVISLTVVGAVGVVYLNKDAIIENVKSKVMESVTGSLGDLGGGLVPDIGSPMAEPSAPIPSGVGLGIPNF